MQSLFNSDIRNNKIRENYILERFQAFKPNTEIIHGDMSQEFEGIDFLIGGKSFDMKWTDIFRPTYAVEISYYNAGNQLKTGWFLDPSHTTQFALFVEADKRREQINAFTFELDDLRRKIQNEVSVDTILNARNQLLTTENLTTKLTFPNTDVYLVKSPKLKESPVNLVIPKHHYVELPSFMDVSHVFGTYAEYEQYANKKNP